MSLDCYSLVTSSHRISQISLSSLHRNSEEIGCLHFLNLLSNSWFSVSGIVCLVTVPSAAPPGPEGGH